jgi:hypothetical protein
VKLGDQLGIRRGNVQVSDSRGDDEQKDTDDRDNLSPVLLEMCCSLGVGLSTEFFLLFFLLSLDSSTASTRAFSSS